MMIIRIKCFVNENDSNQKLIAAIKRIVSNDTHITLKKSWENGYHIEIFGLIEKHCSEQYYAELDSIVKQNPTKEYDPNEFREKYKKVAVVTKKYDALENVYQNVIFMTRQDNVHPFENMEQLKVYLLINRIFDDNYMQKYFKINKIQTIARDAFEFAQSLPEKIIHEEQYIHSNGFVSHLSHYLGFINSLTDDSKKRKVHSMFLEKAQVDTPHLVSNEATHNDIVSRLNEAHHLISRYVDQGIITFYSPYSKKRFLTNMVHASDRHAAVFNDEATRELVLKDSVLCTNRWVLNVLYEKIVLLGIKPIDKFYMNFLISKFKYEKTLLEVI